MLSASVGIEVDRLVGEFDLSGMVLKRKEAEYHLGIT